MFEDSESKLIKIHNIIEEIYGDNLHKKGSNRLSMQLWVYWLASLYIYIELQKD